MVWPVRHGAKAIDASYQDGESRMNKSVISIPSLALTVTGLGAVPAPA